MTKVEYVFDLGMGHGLLNRIQNGVMKNPYRLDYVRMKKFRPLKHTLRGNTKPQRERRCVSYIQQ